MARIPLVRRAPPGSMAPSSLAPTYGSLAPLRSAHHRHRRGGDHWQDCAKVSPTFLPGQPGVLCACALSVFNISRPAFLSDPQMLASTRPRSLSCRAGVVDGSTAFSSVRQSVVRTPMPTRDLPLPETVRVWGACSGTR